MVDRGPWFISDTNAVARAAKAVADFEVDVGSVIVVGMPRDVVEATLARLGYDRPFLKRLLDIRDGVCRG
jgi:hypothetical protein